MSAQPVQHIFFAFPELMLVLVALMLLIGRYTGYRLTELLRFRVLAEPARMMMPWQLARRLARPACSA